MQKCQLYQDIMVKIKIPICNYIFKVISLLQEAEKIGFPVLIKAVMGGGGRGMRIVRQKSEFFQALENAKNESLQSFKD